MKQMFTEVDLDRRGPADAVREQLAQIPGVRIVEFAEPPRHPWSSNWRPFKMLAELHTHDNSPEIVAWVRNVLEKERVYGAFILPLGSFHPAVNWQWVRLELSRDLRWFESLWRLSHHHLHLISPDETYALYVHEDEGWARAVVKRRSALGPAAGHLDLAAANITEVKRLGSYAISGDLDGNASLWRLSDRRIRRVFEGYSEFANAVRLRGNLAVSLPNSSTPWLWDTATGELLREFKLYEEGGSIGKIVPVDRHYLLTMFTDRNASSDRNGGIGLWDADVGELRRIYDPGNWAQDLAYLGLGSLAVALSDGSVQIWKLSGEKPIRTLPGHKEAITCIQGVEGNNALLSSSFDKSVRYWNLQSGESHQLLAAADPILALGKLDDHVFTISGERTHYPQRYEASLWRYQTGELQATLEIAAPANVPFGIERLDRTTMVIQFGDAIQAIEINERADGVPEPTLIGKLRAPEELS